MDKEQKTSNINAFNDNKEILKKHFSHCFDKNGDFDIEKFTKELSNENVNFSKESYGLEWLGKSYARLLASDSVTTLLKENKDWNNKEENKNSQNLLIKGDNLEVLKHLSNAYHEKIKMIYIDPPYNTGNDDFIYEDDRKFTEEEFSKLTGVDKKQAKKILSFVKNKSNSHSAWLTFMYPRLYIAKQLLKEDGVIFISIDDNEVAQLKILMDEIFGEENFVENFVWINNQRGRSTDKHISNTYENILMFSKSIDKFSINDELEEDEHKLSDYNLKDDISYYKKGDNLFNNNSQFNIETRPNLVYSIYVNKKTNEWICDDEKYLNEQNQLILPLENKKGDDYIKIIPPVRNTNNKMGCWRWGIEKFNKDAKSELILEEKSDGTFMFYTKNRLDDDGNKWNKHKNVIQNITSISGTNELVNIFQDKIFNSPKPTDLLIKLSKIIANSNDIILDFFAGSGTTGDAVMQLNAQDGGNRKYILVQIPEKIDSKKNKTAFDFVKNDLNINNPTIFEITKERLIRAAKKLKDEVIKNKIAEKEKEIKQLEQKLGFENKKETIKELNSETENLKNQDLGFKIFETIPVWENYNFQAEKFSEEQKLFNESNLTKDDLQTLITTWKTYDGILLTENLKEIQFNEYTAYYFENKLYLINKDFKTEHLKIMLEQIDNNKDFNPATIIVFGYNFESKSLREIAENISSYSNKKSINIDFITRY